MRDARRAAEYFGTMLDPEGTSSASGGMHPE
jgi:hypothetical protein